MRLLWAWIGCAGTAPRPEGPRIGHATTWDGLVAAAARGDLAVVHVQARDLVLGDVPEDDPAASSLGAALGFLQIVDDPADVADAVDRARAACTDCHARHGVAAPVR